MKDNTILTIASRIRPFSDAAIVYRMPWYDNTGFYHAWKIREGEDQYLIKRTDSPVELAVYQAVSSRTDVLPRFYGSTSFRNKTYLLLEFVEGHDMMHAARDDLQAVLHAMVRLQDSFWNEPESIGESFTDVLEKNLKRKSYLSEPMLLEAFDRFETQYRTVPRTLCHDDFLPFNLITGRGRTVFIDWEYAGILPYPVMLARLLAHTSTNGETPFFMTPEDRDYAIAYYYDNLIARHGIAYADYRKTLDCFLFFERLEWVYVYRKYNKKSDTLYRYELDAATHTAERILKND